MAAESERVFDPRRTREFTLDKFVRLLDRPRVTIDGQAFEVRSFDELTMWQFARLQALQSRQDLDAVHERLQLLLLPQPPPLRAISSLAEALRVRLPLWAQWWRGHYWLPSTLIVAMALVEPRLWTVTDAEQSDEPPGVFDVGQWLKQWNETLHTGPQELLHTPLFAFEAIAKAQPPGVQVIENPTLDQFLSLFG